MSEPHWRIELLGGLRVRCGERVVTHFESRKVSALLACLALRLPHAQSRELLAEQIWPEEEWEVTRNRLRQGLSSLRQTLEPQGRGAGSVLQTDHSYAGLDPAAVTTDVLDFEAALTSSSSAGSPEEAINGLRRAVSLYQDELLPGYYEEWLVSERERLAVAYEDALAKLAKAFVKSGDLSAAIGITRRLIAAAPLREDAHLALMRLYVATGRSAEAQRQYRDMERVLREQLGTFPSTTARALVEQLRDSTAVSLRPEPGPHHPSSGAPADRVADPLPESGAVALHSPLYVVRPTDRLFQTAIGRGDSIVLVKGSRQVGKTSLLVRGLNQAREAGASVVLTDLQKLDADQLATPAAFFRSLAEMIVDQLNLEASLDDMWDPRRGWNVNFERFLRRDVLGSLSTRLVWGLDEVDRLFTCPFGDAVFGLFRSWHNERALNPTGHWHRLTLAIAYATEAHLFITDLNQSPFNVGTRLELEDFTEGEVAELSRRCGVPLSDGTELARFYGMVGGHPYLVRRALHCTAAGSLTVQELEMEPEREGSVFGDHLRRMLAALNQDASLCDAVRAVLQGKPCPSAASFYRLRSAGVLAGDTAGSARMRCGIYTTYLGRHLS